MKLLILLTIAFVSESAFSGVANRMRRAQQQREQEAQIQQTYATITAGVSCFVTVPTPTYKEFKLTEKSKGAFSSERSSWEQYYDGENKEKIINVSLAKEIYENSNIWYSDSRGNQKGFTYTVIQFFDGYLYAMMPLTELKQLMGSCKTQKLPK